MNKHNTKPQTQSNKPLTGKHMDKQKWVSLFQDIGLDDASMRRWHMLFEARHPQQHQAILQWLSISDDEIRRIRSQ